MNDRFRLVLMAVVVLSLAFGAGSYLTSAPLTTAVVPQHANCTHAESSSSCGVVQTAALAACPVTGATAQSASTGASCCGKDEPAVKTAAAK
jgi:hypothetical protein